jgi:hypothetical protein
MHFLSDLGYSQILSFCLLKFLWYWVSLSYPALSKSPSLLSPSHCYLNTCKFLPFYDYALIGLHPSSVTIVFSLPITAKSVEIIVLLLHLHVLNSQLSLNPLPSWFPIYYWLLVSPTSILKLLTSRLSTLSLLLNQWSSLLPYHPSLFCSNWQL